jgi:predicted dehydrogenase
LFIEAHRLAQFNPRGTDVSVIFDLMIHDLDIVLSLNDSEVTGIHASGVAVVSDTPDIANARIEFANGCVANLTASRMSVKKMRKARFFQKDAYISVDFLKRKTEVIRMKPLEGDPDPLAIVVDTGRGDDRKVIHFDNPEVPETNAIRDELSGFAEAIRNGTPPGVTAHDGYRAVKVAHAISEKIKTASPLLA